MAEETDVARRIAQLEAELEGRTISCVCGGEAAKQYAEINADLHEKELGLRRQAEASSSRLLRECEGLRRAAAITVPILEELLDGPHYQAGWEALNGLKAALSRQEPAPKPEAMRMKEENERLRAELESESGIERRFFELIDRRAAIVKCLNCSYPKSDHGLDNGFYCKDFIATPESQPEAATKPCGEYCQDAPDGSGEPCGKPHLPAPSSPAAPDVCQICGDPHKTTECI